MRVSESGQVGGEQPALVDDCGFCFLVESFYFHSYLRADRPTAWPGLFRKELGTGGQKGCYGSWAWTVMPRNRGGGSPLLSMSGVGGMRLRL